MAYTKHTWASQELITADKLNHIETGIGDAGNDITDIKNDISSYKPDNPIRPKYWTGRHTPGQGATIINGYLYTFVGASSKVGDVQSVMTKNLTKGHYQPTGAYYDGTELGDITHNLGHCNSVDFIYGKTDSYDSISPDTGYLVVGNGTVDNTATISLFNKVNNSVKFFDNNKAVNISFSEGSKSLGGWGGFCFGEDYKTLFYVRNTSGHLNTITINKILLGTGSNNYSDTSTNKNDLTKWGTYTSGKSDFEYNGTAKILSTYTVDATQFNFVPQPQDLTFYDNRLYVGTGTVGNNVFVYRVHADSVELERNLHPSDTFTRGGETESVAIWNNTLYVVGGLTSATSLAWEYDL